MLTLPPHVWPPHPVVNRLESFFEEATSMYSITAEKSRSPHVSSASVFIGNAADAVIAKLGGAT
jgi:hypothetical protein